MPGPSWGLNALATVLSFVFPGLGQLLQGRTARAAIMFVPATLIWFVLVDHYGWTTYYVGWAIHIWSASDAATFSPAPAGAFVRVEDAP